MPLDPHVLVICAATLGVGWLMALSGLQKSALELKRRRRICPSCGKQISSRVCTTCS